MKYLFVGGPRHGEMVDLPDNRRVWVTPVVIPPLTAASWINEYYAPAPTTLHTCEYERADVGTDRLVYIAKRVNPR